MENDREVSGQLLSLTEDADANEVMESRSAELSVRLIPREEGEGKPLILIEGTAESLLFLADLLIGLARHTEDCGVQIRAGRRAWFNAETEYGLYLHRLPCVNDELRRGESPDQ